ncbi:MAG: hypothetical protein RLN72_14320, partial [Henriciella sp.]
MRSIAAERGRQDLSIWRRIGLVFVLALLALSLFQQVASAHPEDEFCTPGGGLDPALCRALSEMDRPATGETPGDVAQQTQYTETQTI